MICSQSCLLDFEVSVFLDPGLFLGSSVSSPFAFSGQEMSHCSGGFRFELALGFLIWVFV